MVGRAQGSQQDESNSNTRRHSLPSLLRKPLGGLVRAKDTKGRGKVKHR